MEDQKLVEVRSFYRRLYWRMRIDYGIYPDMNDQMKEFIEESMLLGKTPDEVVKEFVEESNLFLNPVTLN